MSNLIYESPDGGKTVYCRQTGKSERILLSDPLFCELWHAKQILKGKNDDKILTIDNSTISTDGLQPGTT